MFGSKKRIEKRKENYDRTAADVLAKMQRCTDPDLIDKLGEVYDAVLAMSYNISDLNGKQDKIVRKKLSLVMSINDKTYPDVKERFDKDCATLISIVSGGQSSGYQLTFKEKASRKKRLEKEERDKNLETALENVKKYADEIIELDAQLEIFNAKIRKEKDDNKAALILRERKNVERLQLQKVALKKQNDQIIMLNNNELYLTELKKINASFDLKRMAATAKDLQKMQAEQQINDRLFNEIMEMTDKSMGLTTGAVTKAELDELKALRKKVEVEDKEKVFDRSEEVISKIEEEYEEELEPEQLV